MKFYEFLKKAVTFQKKSDKLSSLEKIIGYSFKDIRLLIFAITHSSKSDDKNYISHFERMEFLGDSILGFIVTDILFHNYPSKREGDLTKMKSKLVSRKFLSSVAEKLNLINYLSLSRLNNNKGTKTILGNTMESLIAAIYLDGGIEPTKKFIKKHILKNFKEKLDDDYLKNYKSILQEFTQKKYHTVPKYQLISQEGPEHNKFFVVSLSINNQVYSRGRGKNKKAAEQEAAKETCIKLGLIK